MGPFRSPEHRNRGRAAPPYCPRPSGAPHLAPSALKARRARRKPPQGLAHSAVGNRAVAVAGLAAAGYEKEAGSLLRGVLAAAEAFDHRLPEMYAGEQRAQGTAPLPHSAACRPASTAAAAGVLLLASLAGIRPDVPAGTVPLRPVRSAPLGEIGLTGLRIAGAPFSVRVSRLGLARGEEAVEGLQLGV